MASEILKSADEKGITNNIAGFSFDTTSSNTGLQAGACPMIERVLGRICFHFACRHHILEILISAIFALFFASSGPDIALFSRFKQNWTNIVINNYKPIDENELTAAENDWLKNNCDEIVEFIIKELTIKQYRDDYREFLEISLLFLGKVFPRGVHISRPGAYHRARWMARGIYCLKIFLFRDQFQLTQHETDSLRKINVFCVSIYLKAWFQCQNSENAAVNDLYLLSKLEDFEKVNSSISQTALRKFKSHLWYLSEYLVRMAFFSSELSVSEKKGMVDS